MSECNFMQQGSGTRPNVALQLKALRQQFGLSQLEFAQTFALSVGTIRDWEQDRVRPDRASRVLLQVIADNPNAVQQALHRTQSSESTQPSDSQRPN